MSAIEQHILFQVVDQADELIAPLFAKKFGGAPPANSWPHHLCAFWRAQPGTLRLLSYAHFGKFGDTCLVGGMCTDGDVMRAMPPELVSALASEGGVAMHLLRYGFAYFADRFDAFYGLVADPRALAVDLAAGFVETGHPKLVRYLPRPLADNHLRCLDAKILALGDF